MQLSKVLFWDTDMETLDWERHAKYVIERVVQRGTWEDWKQIKKFYGLERIKNEMLQVRYIDKKTLSFLSSYFQIPKEKFRCYTTRQSIPAHWDY